MLESQVLRNGWQNKASMGPVSNWDGKRYPRLSLSGVNGLVADEKVPMQPR